MKLNLEIISKSTGQKVRLRDYNVIPQDIVINSIEQKDFYDTVDGSSRRVFKGTQDVSRVIEVPFFTYDINPESFPMIRDDLYGLFGTDEFYIREIRYEQYATGKQFLVKLSNVISPKQQHVFSEGKLVFETTETPYGESIETTQQVHQYGITDNGNWSAGMGLQTTDDKEFKYTFDTSGTTVFEVYNAGNVDVHPFQAYLKIIIKSIVATGTKLSIINDTNGTRIDINEKSASSDVWLFDGAIIKKNSLNGTHLTNRTFLTISKGNNRLRVTGASSLNISFDFKYLYR